MVGPTALVSAIQTTDRKPFQQQEFSEVDLNGDSLISKTEYNTHAKTHFDTVDTNGYGALSLDEIISQRPLKMAVRVQIMIATSDTNSDVLVDFEELESIRGGIFIRFDSDNDSVLSAEEFSRIKKRHGKVKKRSASEGSNKSEDNN